MKNIELTEDHKSKLLEMCKELFPEYVEIDFNKSGLLTLWKEKCPSIQWSEIHWFEFCITKLSVKILCQNKNIINSSYSKNYFLQNKIINSDEHIVNYLYKEFKKLK